MKFYAFVEFAFEFHILLLLAKIFEKMPLKVYQTTIGRKCMWLFSAQSMASNDVRILCSGNGISIEQD